MCITRIQPPQESTMYDCFWEITTRGSTQLSMRSSQARQWDISILALLWSYNNSKKNLFLLTRAYNTYDNPCKTDTRLNYIYEIKINRVLTCFWLVNEQRQSHIRAVRISLPDDNWMFWNTSELFMFMRSENASLYLTFILLRTHDR